jgi:heparosan-N-sulfate-glucuronate 5-epimerase
MDLIKNKYAFFLLRFLKDIFRPTKWPISRNLTSTELGEYYFVFREESMVNQKGGQKSIIYDDKGIPLNPTYIDVRDKDFVYFPITIGQVGLAVFHSYLGSGSDEDKKRFLNFVDWFVQHSIEKPGLGCLWLTDVGLPQYRNPGPWQSAFAQSRAISILLRGFQLSGEKRYADLAEKALIPFTVAVDKGGVTSFTQWGPFYEEYTAAVPTLVLNGMIFSLCGISDFVRVFPHHQLAIKLFNEGLQTLENILPAYDIGYWSRYNLCTAEWYPPVDPATITYQHLHISQLNMLYALTQKTVFREYALRFQKQINLIDMIRMYLLKYRALKKLGRV